MIDLRENGLPSGFELDGIFYELDTNFRTWIAFDYDMRTYKIAPSYVFVDRVPDSESALEPMLEFYRCENATPRPSGREEIARAYDFVLDGSYIVASFQQAYGIDLTSIGYMHWHRFLALLNGLPSDTILGRAMSNRLYRKDGRDYEEIMSEQRRLWALPTAVDEQAEAELVEWAEGMGL